MRTIYLNRDPVELHPGISDSRTNASSLVPGVSRTAGWNVSQDVWQSVVSCISEKFGAFDVRVIDQSPGNESHLEVVFSEHPAELGLASNIGGLSPLEPCKEVPNSIALVFARQLGNNVRFICETAAQEIGHSFGLDHVVLPGDVMSYLDAGSSPKAFLNQYAPCGEFTDRSCGCREKQNSYLDLEAVLGPRNEPEVLVQGCHTGSEPGLGFLLAALLVLRHRVTYLT